jgi:hypothetical protein
MGLHCLFKKSQEEAMRFSSVVIVFSLLTAMHTQAATVFKCVDAKGKITFTQGNCPDNHALNDVVSAENPTISGSSAPSTMVQRRRAFAESSSQYSASSPSSGAGSSVTVVGASRERPPCDTGLNDRDLRTAKVRGQVVPGMDRKDIEQSMGNKEQKSQGGGGDYYASHNHKDATYISYDNNGCASRSYNYHRD